MPRNQADEYEDEDDRGGRRRSETFRPSGPRVERGRGNAAVGIASLIASLLAGVMVFALAAVAGVLTATRGDLAEDSPEAILIGLGIMAGLGLALLAVILGVIGLFQSPNKLFSILGTSFGGLVLLGTAALLCAGILAG